MTRRVGLYLVGSLVLVSLAGCGRGFFQFAEREPWRAEAELACLKSGEVKEGANIVRISPISGPGVCGADYPLKVAALGEGNALGFADDMRPPGAIPGSGADPRQPRWPASQPNYAQPNYAPAQPSYAPPAPAGRIERAPIDAPSSHGAQSQGAQPYGTQPYDNSAGSAGSGPLSLRAPGTPADDEQILEEPGNGRGGSPAYPQQQPYAPRQRPLPRLGPAPGAVGSIGPVAVKPNATLACPIVAQLDRWINDSVQPAAQRWFGVAVVEIKQISAYSCRGMNGNPHAHISEHAFGNALDIAAFTLADGRRVTVEQGWRGLPEEQGFLRDIQGAACQQFTTVLAPGSNVHHYNHIHVDLMRRASQRVICQPAAVSGEEVASRAGRSGRYAARDNSITGSIAAAGKRAARFFSRAPKEDDWVEDESSIRDK